MVKNHYPAKFWWRFNFEKVSEKPKAFYKHSIQYNVIRLQKLMNHNDSHL